MSWWHYSTFLYWWYGLFRCVYFQISELASCFWYRIRPGLPSFYGLRTAPRMGHWGSHCVGLARWQDVTGEVEWMSPCVTTEGRDWQRVQDRCFLLVAKCQRYCEAGGTRHQRLRPNAQNNRRSSYIHPQMPTWLADTWVSLFRRSIKSQTNCATSLPNVLMLGVVSSCFCLPGCYFPV